MRATTEATTTSEQQRVDVYGVPEAEPRPREVERPPPRPAQRGPEEVEP